MFATDCCRLAETTDRVWCPSSELIRVSSPSNWSRGISRYAFSTADQSGSVSLIGKLGTGFHSVTEALHVVALGLWPKSVPHHDASGEQEPLEVLGPDRQRRGSAADE
jgi:hypothetical protein